MLAPRHLRNAPITEAVLDIRVKPRSGFDISEFEKVGTALDDGFVSRKEVFQGSIEIDVGQKEPVTKIEREASGFQFWSKDNREAVFFRRDGLSLSRLHPYTNWDDVFAKMKPLVRRYLEISKPEEIVRIAVRYINKITILVKFGNLGDYLVSPPVVPAGLPQMTSSFLNHLVIHEQTNNLAAAVTQASQRGPNGEFVVLLDIDAFKNGVFNVDDPEIWVTFEHLHRFKNQIFFASITDKTAKLFE